VTTPPYNRYPRDTCARCSREVVVKRYFAVGCAKEKILIRHKPPLKRSLPIKKL
jgi:DNA-directed RNA polymerase subunit RPC12/RpoP